MKFVYTERKINVRDNVKEYAEKKIGKLDRLFKGESVAYITFSVQKNRFKVELTVENNGMFFRVSETTSDIFASIDSVVASVERQVRKNKTRLEKRLREGALEREFVPSVAIEPEEEEGEFDIIKTKRFSIKPMSVEEAILQMNLLEHEFFVFKNHDADDSFSVVYRRKDGGYGLIEPSGD